MVHNGKDLKAYLDTLSEQLSEQVEARSVLSASLRRTSEEQIIIIPNKCSFSVPHEELRSLAIAEDLPVSRLQLAAWLPEQRLYDPAYFFRSMLIYIALVNGFGSININFTEPRSWIGTIEISVRGHRNRPKS